MKTVSLSLALGGVVAALPLDSSLPSGVSYDLIGEHLRESVTIYAMQNRGNAQGFEFRRWVRENYPQILVPVTSNAASAVVQLYNSAEVYD